MYITKITLLNGVEYDIRDADATHLPVSIISETLTDGQVLKYDAANDVWYNADDEGPSSAGDIEYDNTTSGLTADDVQEAIDEVNSKVENLPSPMVYKGQLGTGGVISVLPVDGSADVGDTYKVITAGTYAGVSADVGDMFTCLTKTSSANTWDYFPSGDEPDALSALTDVVITNPSDGQRLVYDETLGKWVNASDSGSGNISDLGDVNIGTLNNNDVLAYNSTSQKWENKTGYIAFKDVSGTLAAGSTSITLSSNYIAADSLIQIFTSKGNVNYLDISSSVGSVTVVFPAQSEAMTVTARISCESISLGGLNSTNLTPITSEYTTGS